MKKIHTAVTLIIIFFMVAALYICGRYENVPDRIFTGKVSAPEGEWTIDASDGVTKAEVTFSLSDRGEHEEWVLLLRSHWKNYYVRVGDETIYHRNGKRDGSVHLFDIPSGNSLTISFIGGTKDNLKGIERSGILIGDKTSMYRQIIKDNLYAVLIGVLSLVLGVMCTVACSWCDVYCRLSLYESGKNGEDLPCTAESGNLYFDRRNLGGDRLADFAVSHSAHQYY